MSRRRSFWSAFVCILFISIQVHAADRVALIIGNSDYNGDGDTTDFGDIDAASRDIVAMNEVLSDLNFDVISVENAKYGDFKKALREFKSKLDQAKIAVFYYSGHGLTPPEESLSKKQNYLVPVERDLSDALDELESNAIGDSTIKRILTREGLTSLVFLDACRNNPFGEQLYSQLSNKAKSVTTISKGLTFERVGTGAQMLIAHATISGAEATAPRGIGLSFFTGALVEHLPRAESIQTIMARVRESVLDISGGKQKPEFNPDLNVLYLAETRHINPAVKPLVKSAIPAVSIQTEKPHRIRRLPVKGSQQEQKCMKQLATVDIDNIALQEVCSDLNRHLTTSSYEMSLINFPQCQHLTRPLSDNNNHWGLLEFAYVACLKGLENNACASLTIPSYRQTCQMALQNSALAE
jgi:hypothetical protein